MNLTDKLITIADNTSAVAEAVNASKATRLGTVFSVDDVLNVGMPLPVKLESKNLFTTEGRVVRNFGATSNATQRTFTENSVYLNLAKNNYCVAGHRMSYEKISDSSFTVLIPSASQSGWEAYGAGFNFRVKPNTVYSVSASYDSSKGIYLGCGFFDKDGFYITYTERTENITPPDNCVWMNVIFGVRVRDEAVLYEDVQLEVGSTVTEYTPYTTDLADKEVKVYGKNLFNYQWPFKNGASKIVSQIDGVIEVNQTAAQKWCSANIVLPTCYGLEGKTITISGKVKTGGDNNACTRVMWLTNAAGGGGQSFLSKYISSADYVSFTKTGTVPEQPSEEYCNLCLMLYSNVDATITAGQTHTAWYKDLQIEIGSATTDYEAYSEQTGIADADGKVIGFVALSPMLIVADDDTGAEVKYFPTAASEKYDKYQQLKTAEQNLSNLIKENK